MSAHTDQLTSSEIAGARRRRVGWTTIGLFGASAVGFAVNGQESAWAAAAMRTAIVLGALWLCIPARPSRISWNNLSTLKLAIMMLIAARIPQIRIVVVIVILFSVVIWLSRPKPRKGL